MPLNIKDDDVHGKARELATLMGTNLTEAVRAALVEKLADMRSGEILPSPAERARRLLLLGKEIHAELGDDAGTSDHSDLYDGNGLPA